MTRDRHVGIGTASPGVKLHVQGVNQDVHILAKTNDNNVAVLAAHGDSQGAGRLYVGQSNTYGGGIEYNGDNSPTSTGAGADYLALYRVDNGGYHWTARNYYNNNWLFRSRIGIGVSNPSYPLHIDSYDTSGFNQGNRGWIYYGGTVTNSNGYGSWDCSIYTTGSIITKDWLISHTGSLYSSDERIKKHVIDVAADECLQKLRQLQPKKYKYVDRARGDEEVYGFIAQDVANIIPQSTKTTSDFIPNVYEVANVSDSNVLNFINFDTSSLSSNTSNIQVVSIDGKQTEVSIAEVVDEHTIRVSQDVTELAGALDTDGNVVSGTELFVYGERVDDFHTLKKDAIWTVATSALQEVDRIQQQHDAQIADLEAAVASRDQQIDELRGELSDIVSRLESLEA